MIFTVRTIAPDTPDLSTLLDEMHALAVRNYSPLWACSNPPYPSRNELEDMVLRQPLTLVVGWDENGEMFGWDFHDTMGNIRAGAADSVTRFGAVQQMPEPTVEWQKIVAEEIRKNTRGQCYHLAWANPRMWYALEVQCGIPISPIYAGHATVPSEPPPLPDGDGG